MLTSAPSSRHSSYRWGFHWAKLFMWSTGKRRRQTNIMIISPPLILGYSSSYFRENSRDLPRTICKNNYINFKSYKFWKWQTALKNTMLANIKPVHFCVTLLVLAYCSVLNWTSWGSVPLRMRKLYVLGLDEHCSAACSITALKKPSWESDSLGLSKDQIPLLIDVSSSHAAQQFDVIMCASDCWLQDLKNTSFFLKCVQ